MNFKRTIQRQQQILCFPYKDDYITVEYYKDINDNIKILNTNNEILNPIINHINKLQNDLKLKGAECYSCFSVNRYLEKCNHCLKKMSGFFITKKRCPACYCLLCNSCYEYADNNLHNYVDLIMYYKNT